MAGGTDKWPSQYVLSEAEKHLRDGVPAVHQMLADMAARIDTIEAEMQRLEATKADRKGRKPSGVKPLVEDTK